MCHTKPESPIRAIETIEGWIEHLGPCRPFLDATATHARIVTLATELAFDEVPTLGRVISLFDCAHGRWNDIKGKVAGLLMGR